jgi:hypothetical protein
MDELDPTQRLQLDALDAQYSLHHGVAVEYLKAEVGPGDEYSNPAARAVISPNGAWFECIDLPMEFSGAAGAPVSHRFISDAQATSLLNRLYALGQEAVAAKRGEWESRAESSEFGLFALYSRGGIVDGRNVYACQIGKGAGDGAERRQEVGKYQPGVLPLVYRCRFKLLDKADLVTSDLPFAHGVVFCLAHAGEKNLIVEIPYEGGTLQDLSRTAASPVKQ